MLKTIGNICFIVAGILWGMELIPQIIKTIRKKSVGDISVLFYNICLLAYIIYMIGAILSQLYVIALAHIPSFILLVVMLGLILKYRKRRIGPPRARPKCRPRFR